jgi:pyruvate,orthophosphate dikinase
MPKAKKHVYLFANGRAEGKGSWKEILGGKGAGLAEMTHLGIRVPAGFTITTEACIAYFEHRKQYPSGLWEQVLAALRKVEQAMGARFGDPRNPLLVSVRSGARASMPGMMDTVLNIGLNEATLEGLIRRTGNERFGYDAYRRFVTMFGDVVLGVDRSKFETLLERQKALHGARLDTDLEAPALRDLVRQFKDLVQKETSKPFPEAPLRQLRMAIDAVFNSWYGQRAVTYRKIHGIPHTWGTAANVQAMVFGNTGDRSGTGVGFTRDPATGERRFYAEYLLNAQGEDVVAGIRTPHPIAKLKQQMPKVYRELERIYKKLERHYRDMQDIEFTIQDGTLYLLQTRTGKRTARAAIRIAVEMAREGLITKQEALLRVDPSQIDQLLHPMIDPKAEAQVIAKGLGSTGAAVGKVVFSPERAEEWSRRGEKVILVRHETSPEDVGGMHASEGILTATGGLTSHAAVVARGMGKCSVVGCGEVRIREEEKFFTVGDLVVREGETIALNGNTGEVILGEVHLIKPEPDADFQTFLRWADAERTLRVRANADTPADAAQAVKFGAEGIGLCRTEHMFFGEGRIPHVRAMILARDEGARRKALEQLLPMQREDFLKIFQAMNGRPVTIRLLDPPLHEFLPKYHEVLQELTRLRLTGGDPDAIRDLETLFQRIGELHEFNPMLGHRGCRLGITFPEIYEMQVQAIFEAACACKRQGKRVIPEVMIPLTGTRQELADLRALSVRTAEEVMRRERVRVRYLIGTMIEVPRAALVADQLAEEAEFFSFGTNDLTQMTFGYSRDDAGKFLPCYVEKGILPGDPFASLDVDGVGELVRVAKERGRKVRPDLKLGICGEHGGDPRSIAFFHQAGLNYVSCSPYSIPVARLAAAQARLREQKSVVR